MYIGGLNVFRILKPVNDHPTTGYKQGRPVLQHTTLDGEATRYVMQGYAASDNVEAWGGCSKAGAEFRNVREI